MTTQAPPKTEEFKITGDELLAKFRELVHEGNVRRLIIKSDSGITLLEVPLTIGVIGAACSRCWPPSARWLPWPLIARSSSSAATDNGGSGQLGRPQQVVQDLGRTPRPGLFHARSDPDRYDHSHDDQSHEMV